MFLTNSIEALNYLQALKMCDKIVVFTWTLSDPMFLAKNLTSIQ